MRLQDSGNSISFFDIRKAYSGPPFDSDPVSFFDYYKRVSDSNLIAFVQPPDDNTLAIDLSPRVPADTSSHISLTSFFGQERGVRARLDSSFRQNFGAPVDSGDLGFASQLDARDDLFGNIYEKNYPKFLLIDSAVTVTNNRKGIDGNTGTSYAWHTFAEGDKDAITFPATLQGQTEIINRGEILNRGGAGIRNLSTQPIALKGEGNIFSASRHEFHTDAFLATEDATSFTVGENTDSLGISWRMIGGQGGASGPDIRYNTGTFPQSDMRARITRDSAQGKIFTWEVTENELDYSNRGFTSRTIPTSSSQLTFPINADGSFNDQDSQEYVLNTTGGAFSRDVRDIGIGSALRMATYGGRTRLRREFYGATNAKNTTLVLGGSISETTSFVTQQTLEDSGVVYSRSLPEGVYKVTASGHILYDFTADGTHSDATTPLANTTTSNLTVASNASGFITFKLDTAGTSASYSKQVTTSSTSGSDTYPQPSWKSQTFSIGEGGSTTTPFVTTMFDGETKVGLFTDSSYLGVEKTSIDLNFDNIRSEFADSSYSNYGGIGRTASSGFASGGAISVSNVTNSISKYPFAAEIISTDVADITVARTGASGTSSSSNGYTAGGHTHPFNSSPGSASNVIDKFPFAISSGTGSDVGDLAVAMTLNAGAQSATHGYVMGGTNDINAADPAPVTFMTDIQRFPFSTPVSVSNTRDLSEGRYALSGHSNPTYGYAAGGIGILAPAQLKDTIDKFPFAYDANAADLGDLTVARGFVGGVSSGSHGYVGGGSNHPDKTFVEFNTIDKFPFSTDTNATDVGDLASERYAASGQSSNAYGYYVGGSSKENRETTTNYLDTIEKFSFASDGKVANVGTLVQAKREAAGQQG